MAQVWQRLADEQNHLPDPRRPVPLNKFDQ
jgi:hypothetical protein